MDYTMLVNKYHKITKEEIEKIKKVSSKNVRNEDILVEEETLFCFNKLKKFIKAKENITIGIEGAFRSIEEQEKILDELTNTYGKEYSKKYVAMPKTSEHHTALAIDFVIEHDGKYPKDNDEIMKDKDIYEKLHKYLSNFGFILRYPKGKEKITKYNYEPWHIRYVGKSAKEIEEKNLTLEEYYIKKNSGILLVNKEKDMTSRDVVNIVSKTLGIKKVGHTGTLDPLATGLLVITIGDATKIGELLITSDKEYIAQFKLGVLTDTLDITGNILKTKEIKKHIDINQALKYFTKTYMQEVPIFSAVKIKGKKLYEYARENKKIDLPKKEVTIKKLELLEEKDNTYKIKCLVSKGTYIRSLIRDIGEYLNTYATMTSLERISQNKLNLKDAYKVDEIKNNKFKIIPIKDALNIKKITIKDNLLFKVKNGAKINLNEEEKVLFLDQYNNPIAIYEGDGRAWKVFS